MDSIPFTFYYRAQNSPSLLTYQMSSLLTYGRALFQPLLFWCCLPWFTPFPLWLLFHLSQRLAFSLPVTFVLSTSVLQGNKWHLPVLLRECIELGIWGIFLLPPPPPPPPPSLNWNGRHCIAWHASRKWISVASASAIEKALLAWVWEIKKVKCMKSAVFALSDFTKFKAKPNTENRQGTRVKVWHNRLNRYALFPSKIKPTIKSQLFKSALCLSVFEPKILVFGR